MIIQGWFAAKSNGQKQKAYCDLQEISPQHLHQWMHQFPELIPEDGINKDLSPSKNKKEVHQSDSQRAKEREATRTTFSNNGGRPQEIRERKQSYARKVRGMAKRI